MITDRVQNKLKPLIRQSVLDIIEYDIQTRTEMEQLDRKLSCGIMSYLKSGEAIVRIGQKEYRQTAGSAVFIPPECIHDHIKVSEENAEFIWWHFNLRTNYGLDILTLLRLPVVVRMKDAAEFEQKFRDFIGVTENENSIADFIYKNAKAMEVLACIFNSFLNSEHARITSKVPDVFFEIMDGISKNPRADMTLFRLSEMYHMHSTYISNKFKEYFGVSPIVLQRKLLLQKSKDMLLNTDKSIYCISEELGFSEHAVFTRFFVERVGMSPNQFRNTSF